jgi:hypothetical protein
MALDALLSRKGGYVGRIAGLHTRTPPECHWGGRGLASPYDACE